MKVLQQQEEKHGFDLLEEAERVRGKAWELLSKMESEGDHRGSVVAFREVRECLETLASLLSDAGGGSLAGLSNDAILKEVKRRGLEVPTTISIRFVESSM